MGQQRRNRHRGRRSAYRDRGAFKLAGIAVLVVAVVAAIIGALAYASRPDPYKPQANFDNNGGTGQPVDGIKCATSEQLLFHIHAHLDIFAGGKKVTVPSQIGIPGNCLYWLHTHDASGVIHVESPVRRTYTLGDFFDIWGAPLQEQSPLVRQAPRSRSASTWTASSTEATPETYRSRSTRR